MSAARAVAWVVLACVSSGAMSADYMLYFVGGQSNAVGLGYTRDLPADEQGAVEGAVIYSGRVLGDGEVGGGVGVWSPVTPGFGSGFKTDGETNALSGRFGPELSLARRLRELRPDERVAIIRYAKGGSSLDVRVRRNWGTWDPADREPFPAGVGVNQYDHALATIARATGVHDIDGDGEPDRLIPAGIVWMQGEADSTTRATAEAYEANLAQMLELLRAALRADELPVAVGQITDSGTAAGGEPRRPYSERVRAAQAAVCEKDPMATLITATDGYAFSDPSHYDSAGYLDMGRRFAEAIHALRVAGEAGR